MQENSTYTEAARKVINLAKASLLAENHYLSHALGQLSFVPHDQPPAFALNGSTVFYNAQALCTRFIQEQAAPTRELLHCMLHCLLLHPLDGAAKRPEIWNLACDMQVESLVSQLSQTTELPGDDDRHRILADVGARCQGAFSALHIYQTLGQTNLAEQLPFWSQLFAVDDHVHWYEIENNEYREKKPSSSNGEGEGVSYESSRNTQRTLWRRTARSLALSLKTHTRNKGEGLGGFIQELEEAAHIRLDFSEFLRQFATPGETLKISEEEFDYLFYTYGLKLYGNVPLIEPLEYRDDKRVREFVIAIDTSGSVLAEAVKAFVNHTFDVLKSSESFFDHVNIHILQCDTTVRKDDIISNESDLKEWNNNFLLIGGGGTDFSPVFTYVDELIERGYFENLGGLIYFTDGWGDYPSWIPSYRTAFIFYDNDYRPETVPPWAAQFVLGEANLQEMRTWTA